MSSKALALLLGALAACSCGKRRRADLDDMVLERTQQPVKILADGGIKGVMGATSPPRVEVKLTTPPKFDLADVTEVQLRQIVGAAGWRVTASGGGPQTATQSRTVFINARDPKGLETMVSVACLTLDRWDRSDDGKDLANQDGAYFVQKPCAASAVVHGSETPVWVPRPRDSEDLLRRILGSAISR